MQKFFVNKTIQLHHGDCVAGMKNIRSGSVDLICTDPPYEITDMREAFAEMVRVLAEHGSMYIFGDKNIVAEYWFSQLLIKHKTLLIWHYENSPKPRGRWRMSMQAIIYAYKDSKKSIFIEDEARVPYRPATLKLNGRLRPSSGRMEESKPYDTSKGALPRDVINHPALLGHLSRERVGHRDQKPLELIKKLILTSSKSNDLVLDPYSGSGTTLRACADTGRRGIGFEISDEWIPIIVDRLKD